MQQDDYRIFVGAFPEGDYAQRIQAIRAGYDPVTARITAPHVTIAGTYWRNGPATPENEQTTIAQLQEIQGQLTCFDLLLGGIATFPPQAKPVIYHQVESTLELLAIRQKLLQTLGRDKHRHFTPHLTLAMRLNPTAAQQMLTDLTTITWLYESQRVPIQHLALMQRGPHDPAWRQIASVPLVKTRE